MMRSAALAALLCSDVAQKTALVAALTQDCADTKHLIPEPPGVPGRPVAPALVDPTPR
jgi:hypothetical protein